MVFNLSAGKGKIQSNNVTLNYNLIILSPNLAYILTKSIF